MSKWKVSVRGDQSRSPEERKNIMRKMACERRIQRNIIAGPQGT